MASTIVGLLPPHRVYLEPYCGSAAVFFAKPPSRHEIINDRNGAVVAFFRMLRDRPDDLFEGWRRLTWQTIHRGGTSKKASREEVLWFNRDPAQRSLFA